MRRQPAALITSFFFNDTATTEIYTLSLHDALPISDKEQLGELGASDVNLGHEIDHSFPKCARSDSAFDRSSGEDRKSTRLNSSHSQISYAVFCLKKKKLT